MPVSQEWSCVLITSYEAEIKPDHRPAHQGVRMSFVGVWFQLLSADTGRTRVIPHLLKVLNFSFHFLMYYWINYSIHWRGARGASPDADKSPSITSSWPSAEGVHPRPRAHTHTCTQARGPCSGATFTTQQPCVQIDTCSSRVDCTSLRLSIFLYNHKNIPKEKSIEYLFQ